MNFEQNVNEIVNTIGHYRSRVVDQETITARAEYIDGKIDSAANSEGGSRQVRRHYKRELLKRIRYALWAAQLKHKVRPFPEGRYVPFQARPNKYVPHIGKKELARYAA